MKTYALMIDLESLSLQPHAYIAQVGYCVANLDERRITRMPVNMWVRDDDQVGREFDPKTVRWWMGQAQPVRESVFSPVESMVMSADDLFKHFEQLRAGCLSKGDKFTVWAKPAMFDLPMLTDLWGGRKPWSYKEERCLSTLSRSLDPFGKLAPPDTNMAHNAAADADWQMRYLLSLWPVVSQVAAAAEGVVVPA